MIIIIVGMSDNNKTKSSVVSFYKHNSDVIVGLYLILIISLVPLCPRDQLLPQKKTISHIIALDEKKNSYPWTWTLWMISRWSHNWKKWARNTHLLDTTLSSCFSQSTFSQDFFIELKISIFRPVHSGRAGVEWTTLTHARCWMEERHRCTDPPGIEGLLNFWPHWPQPGAVRLGV